MPNILFDMDGVLVDYDPAVRVASLATSIGRTTAQVHAAIYDSGIEAAADAGQLDEQAYFDALSAQLGTRVPTEAWVEARRRATRVRVWAMTLVASLMPGCGVAVLTNNGRALSTHWAAIVPELFPMFTGCALVAAELGTAKPDPIVYLAALARLGWSASETLFIDDVATNVDGAKLAGLAGHAYVGEQSMRDAIATFVDRRR